MDLSIFPNIHITIIFDALPNEGWNRFLKCLNSGDFSLRVEEDEIKSLVRHSPSYEETQFHQCLADLGKPALDLMTLLFCSCTMYMVKRYFAEYCISFSRHKISFAEAVIMCRIRNVEELKIKHKTGIHLE